MCCGEKRQQLSASERVGYRMPPVGGQHSSSPPRRQTALYFEYIGATGLTAIGGGSGARYRFHGHGAVIAVDPRDRRSLSAVPNLKQVASPW
jgi:hypothetical protein